MVTAKISSSFQRPVLCTYGVTGTSPASLDGTLGTGGSVKVYCHPSVAIPKLYKNELLQTSTLQLLGLGDQHEVPCRV